MFVDPAQDMRGRGGIVQRAEQILQFAQTLRGTASPPLPETAAQRTPPCSAAVSARCEADGADRCRAPRAAWRAVSLSSATSRATRLRACGPVAGILRTSPTFAPSRHTRASIATARSSTKPVNSSERIEIGRAIPALAADLVQRKPQLRQPRLVRQPSRSAPATPVRTHRARAFRRRRRQRILARSPQLVEGRRAKRVAESGERRPQTAQPHAHLVDAFGIARLGDRSGVARDDGASSGSAWRETLPPPRILGLELHAARLLRADVAAFERAQASLDLAFGADRERCGVAKLTRHLIQRDRRALFQLKLDFADRNDRRVRWRACGFRRCRAQARCARPTCVFSARVVRRILVSTIGSTGLPSAMVCSCEPGLRCRERFCRSGLAEPILLSYSSRSEASAPVLSSFTVCT